MLLEGKAAISYNVTFCHLGRDSASPSRLKDRNKRQGDDKSKIGGKENVNNLGTYKWDGVYGYGRTIKRQDLEWKCGGSGLASTGVVAEVLRVE